MGHLVQGIYTQGKKDMLYTQPAAGAIATGMDEVGVFIGSNLEGKRTTALSRLNECLDTLIELDLKQDGLTYDTLVSGNGSKGQVVLTDTIVATATEDDVQIIVGPTFGGAAAAWQTKSGMFKVYIENAMKRLNEEMTSL